MTEAALVIGYGNTMRSDDGVGPRIARLLTPAKGVDVLVRHQLVPELADDLRGRRVVVFVDAAATLAPGAVATRPVTASEPMPAPGLTHHVSPETLLLLAERLYDARPRAFLVTVGVSSFDLGEELTPRVAAALPEAVATVRLLLVWPE
jgi:hydrogenase maturation protease